MKSSLPKQLPEDIRRKGSATTLELLRGDIGKRWKLLKHTIVAWTSLPIFRFFYQTKNSPLSPEAPERESMINHRRDSTATTTITPARKNDVEGKRERLHHLIGLDRSEPIAITKTPTVESMLKTQRENFGLSMPVLGQFVRKYMQHRPRSNFGSVRIHAGKAIIYSLLPLSEDIPSNDVIYEEIPQIDVKTKEQLPKSSPIQICSSMKSRKFSHQIGSTSIPDDDHPPASNR